MSLYAAVRCGRALILLSWTALLIAPSLLRLKHHPRSEEPLRTIGLRLATLAERWGPAATKVAQLAASRTDLLPATLLKPLERVQDRVRVPSKRSLRRSLIKAYGPSDRWAFQILSWDPIASGSIAIVLRARTTSGDLLAVKLVRDGVERQVQADLQCLTWLMRALERRPRFSHIPLSQALDEIAQSISRQCDMLTEAISFARLQPSLGTEIRLPRPYIGLSRRSVLAMELLIGDFRLTDRDLRTDLYRSSCRLLLQALYRMIFVQGFVHCDLHPGNIGITGDGGIILYDLGLVAEIGPRDRNILTGLFEAVGNGDASKLAMETLAAASIVPACLNRKALQQDTQAIIDRWSGKTAGVFLVAGLANDLFELQRMHGLQGRPSFAAAIWALVTYEGLVRDKYPDLDFQVEARPFLTSALIARLRVQSLTQG